MLKTLSIAAVAALATITLSAAVYAEPMMHHDGYDDEPPQHYAPRYDDAPPRHDDASWDDDASRDDDAPRDDAPRHDEEADDARRNVTSCGRRTATKLAVLHHVGLRAVIEDLVSAIIYRLRHYMSLPAA